MAICITNKQIIPQVWISRANDHKQLYELPDSYLAAKKIRSTLLLFKTKLIQEKKWPKGPVWTNVTSTVSKILEKMKLAPISFPSVLTE